MSTMMERYGTAMIKAFGTPQRVLVRGEGPYVWDAEGTRYLDLLGGIAVNALGHCHPRLVAAIAEQAATLMHVSNLFTTPQQIELAERLDALVGGGRHARTFLTNSGSEANEAALKITRLTGRHKIIAMEGAFHGRTLGAIAAGGNPSYLEGFGPALLGFKHTAPGDLAAVEALIGPQTCAILIEPVQGEGGVTAMTADYMRGLRAL